MTTDTPRTDALMHGGCIAINIMEHARQLERELTEAQAFNNKLVKELGAIRASLNNSTPPIETL
jgi:hypothetical protein